jgi:hypothetical protein
MRQTFDAALLRSKGLMNVAGGKGPVVLHGVRDRFELTRSASWPDQERRSRLVIIGRNLNRAQQAAGLGWLYAEAGTQPPGLFDGPPPPLPPPAIGHPHAI